MPATAAQCAAATQCASASITGRAWHRISAALPARSITASCSRPSAPRNSSMMRSAASAAPRRLVLSQGRSLRSRRRRHAATDRISSGWLSKALTAAPGRRATRTTSCRFPTFASCNSTGVEFRRHYANAPVCCPSRATFWSGRHASNLPHEQASSGLPVDGAWNNFGTHMRELEPKPKPDLEPDGARVSSHSQLLCAF